MPADLSGELRVEIHPGGHLALRVSRWKELEGAQIWAETHRENDRDRVPNTNDGAAPTVAGEVVKFTF